MSDDSWAHLSPQDGALIVLSVLLHDCALHLSEDGFYALIGGHYVPGKSRYMHDEPGWPTLWDQFLSEAKRFDQRKLYALFGDTNPIQALPTSKIELTLKHRLLIGEFLRRHHARLAHEIAVSGIPGPEAPVLLADDSWKDFMDLAGFVARSHNMSIRAAVDALEPAQRRVHINCKVPFVMMVLRIADYIQIHSSRAPGQLLRLKSLVSPVSRGEWKKHLSVREINQAHDDPEAIFVDCEPESASTFLSMQCLLRDIQMELDKSWAVLGETYGRFEPLNVLGITIRRVRSNLDDPELFRRTRNPSYLPREFRFKTASAELLDLLVTPLYGDKPDIGIRELVQNAVDACLERNDLILKGLVRFEVKQTEDVVVTLVCEEGKKPKLIVEDFGVGMTPEVVSKYFLNVGASFRSSDVWRKNHETAGRSTVHRTGRFGIGLLAAFLLGPEIRVTTRSIHEGQDSAIEFICRQGDEGIEVKPTTFHHGTRIEVDISDAVLKVLTRNSDEWDWYCLSSPKVRRGVLSNELIHLQQKYIVPDCDSSVDATKWRRISADGYDDVMWSYEALTRWQQPDPVVICNGIFICQQSYQLTPKVSSELNIITAQAPSLIVFDPDGRFPINLQRDKVAGGKAGFENPLAADVSEYFVNRLVEKFEHLRPGITTENVQLSLEPQIAGLRGKGGRDGGLACFILSREGVIPADADVIRESGITSIAIDATNMSAGRGAFATSTMAAWAEFYVARDGVTHTKVSRTDFIRESLGGLGYNGTQIGYFHSIGIVGRRLLIKKSDVAELVKPGNISKALWGRVSLEVDLEGWGLWATGSVPELTLDLKTVCAELDLSGGFGVTLLYFGSGDKSIAKPTGDISPFAASWNQIVRSPILRQLPR